jgi:hypothetical protein
MFVYMQGARGLYSLAVQCIPVGGRYIESRGGECMERNGQYQKDL